MAIAHLFENKAVTDLVTSLRSRSNNASVKVIDAAFWKRGCSSLGLLRYAVLLKYSGKRKGTENLCLMDIKEAIPSVAPYSKGAEIPTDNAVRVIVGARNLSPYLGERMVATQLLDKSVFMRELLPQDLKLEIKSLTCHEAMEAAKFLGTVIAKAHAGQMDDAMRKSWHRELSRGHSRTLDAPSWLWSTVVGLAVNHEGEYLEHCRKFASNSLS